MDETNENVNNYEDFTRKTWRDDVTFAVEGTQLYASKCVLAMYSPVFEVMFGSDFKEKENSVVELPDKKAKDFIEFLQCFYPTSRHSITVENVFQILPLADEYQVRSLKVECERVIETYLSMSDGNLKTGNLLQCYLKLNRHSNKWLEPLCVDELVNLENLELESSEAIDSFSKDEVIELQKKIISEQRIRLEEVNTELVKLFFKSQGTNVTAFESARGVKLQHKIANVFDPELLENVYSKTVKIWDVKFYTIVSVVHDKEPNGQSDKYLSVYLECEFPDEDEDWSCHVQAGILLENTSTDINQPISSRIMSPRYFSYKASTRGYDTFEKLSTFLSKTEKAVENYSCKFVVYILANQPTKIHHQNKDD